MGLLLQEPSKAEKEAKTKLRRRMAGRHGGLESSKIKKLVHQHEKHDLELFWNPKTRIPRGENRKARDQEGAQKHKGTTLWFRVKNEK